MIEWHRTSPLSFISIIEYNSLHFGNILFKTGQENKPSENDELNFEDDCFEDFIEIADKEFNFDERESVEPNECNKSDSDILNNYLGDND